MLSQSPFSLNGFCFCEIEKKDGIKFMKWKSKYCYQYNTLQTVNNLRKIA